MESNKLNTPNMKQPQNTAESNEKDSGAAVVILILLLVALLAGLFLWVQKVTTAPTPTLATPTQEVTEKEEDPTTTPVSAPEMNTSDDISSLEADLEATAELDSLTAELDALDVEIETLLNEEF